MLLKGERFITKMLVTLASTTIGVYMNPDIKMSITIKVIL